MSARRSSHSRRVGQVMVLLVALLSLGTARADVGVCDAPGTDAPSQRSQAKTISVPSVCVGEISSTIDIDAFGFAVSDGAVLEIALAPRPATTLSLRLYAPGDILYTSCQHATICIVPSARAGRWTAEIALQGGAPPVPYILTVAEASTAPVAGALPKGCEPTVDAGDDPESATALPNTAGMTSCIGTLDAGDEDWFKFAVQAIPGRPSTLAISMRALTGRRFTLSLIDPSGAPMPNACSNDEASSCRVTGITTDGEWRIGVRIDTRPSGTYALNIAVTAASAGDLGRSCEPGNDAGNSAQQARAISPPNQCGGVLDGAADTADWFTFTVLEAGPGAIEITLQPDPPGAEGNDLDLSVVGPVAGQLQDGGPGKPDVFLVPGAVVRGTWSFGVARDAGATDRAPYYLTVEQGGTPPDSGPSCEPAGGDAGNASAQATPVSTPSECSGTLNGIADTADWYKFRVLSSGATIEIVLQPYPPGSGDDLTLTVTGPVQGVLIEGGPGGPDVYRVQPSGSASAKGTWNVGVTRGNPAGARVPYQLTINQAGP